MLDHELADGIALEFSLRDALQLGVALLIGCGIVDEQDGASVECIVERLVLEDGGVLQALAQWRAIFCVPFIRAAQMEAVRLFLHQDDVGGTQRAAELLHHALDADIWVFLLDGDARDVVDRDIELLGELVGVMHVHHALDVKGVGEDAAVVVPRDERAPDVVVPAVPQ